ncbi:MAG: sigma-54-dependent Fis family transcriptional regulator [Deltaproteobacteria bacterium]|nr:MAG: sigma-54-dependent Fis family transcriptional regulator [Deltaproteobacteria bacterium]
MERARLLVVDDEPHQAQQIGQLLRDVEVTAVTSGVEAVEVAAGAGDRAFDVVLLDYYMPEMGGEEVLRALRQRGVDARVIVMSGRQPGEVAVEAMRLGAFDFISKPLNRAELRLRVERALRDHRAAARARPPADGTQRRPRKSDVIIGGGTWIKDLYERISMVAPTDVTVAIFGESGTGKELVARTIHALSQRYESPFVVVNCAAIPENLLEDELFGHVKGAFTDATKDREGLFAAAHTGTLFLDEIGEMPLSLQVKLLRVLQSQEFRRIGDDRDTKVDVRLITATNRDLEQAVAAGVFRQDLYYRINVFPLHLPPLRERAEDIPLLAHHFLLKHRAKVAKRVEGFTPEAMAKLCAYDFPGNVRELENTVHHALVMAQSEYIAPEDVRVTPSRAPARSGIDLSRPFRDLKREVVARFERAYTEEVLAAHQGNIAAAARTAGMDRKNLWALVKKYGIDVDAYRAGKG